MSRNTKIVLLVVGAVTTLCVGLCVIIFLLVPRLAERAFSRSPQQARAVGAQIASYRVPPGYQETMGMDLFTTKMVAIAPIQGRGMIFILMSASAPGVNRKEMEQQLRQAFQQQFQRSAGNMQYVGEQMLTIRGQQVPFTITESSSGGGLRQAIGGFSGERGFILLMATASQAEWNDALLTEFAGSIQ